MNYQFCQILLSCCIVWITDIFLHTFGVYQQKLAVKRAGPEGAVCVERGNMLNTIMGLNSMFPDMNCNFPCDL